MTAPDGPDSSGGTPPPPLFSEPGARAWTVWVGPALCLVVLVADLVLPGPTHWFVLLVLAVVLALFGRLMQVAARRHVSVEVTPTMLRDGTEEVPVASIVEVHGPPDRSSYDHAPWETARVLGELSGIPRGRSGVGLELDDGSTVRAWAKDADGLRRVLVDLLAARG